MTTADSSSSLPIPPSASASTHPIAHASHVPYQSKLSLKAQTRIWSTVIFSLSGSMLALGAWMTPSPHGLGTHAENLGLPPCGFYLRTGIPCPTCGCTTAVTWLAHGHVAKAFFVQPFGAVVGLLALAGACLGLIGIVSGRWRGPSVFTLQWNWKYLMWTFGLLLAGGWIYKILMVRAGYN